MSAVQTAWNLTTAAKEKLDLMEQIIQVYITAKIVTDEPLTLAQRQNLIAKFKTALSEAQNNLNQIQALLS